MAVNNLQIAALAASPAIAQPTALGAAPRSPGTPATTPGGGFATALESALRPGLSQAPTATPGAPEDASFGLGRALSVIAALREQTPPATATASPAATASVPLGTASPLGGAEQTTGDAATRRIAAAAGELGVAEAPPGSNDAPRIAAYRGAVPGGGVGPWCAYFVSWVAQQSGTPLGDRGQGFAAVQDVRSWLKGSGRLAEGPAAVGRPGDLVFFDGNRDGVWDHIGLVEAILPDGSVQTIEGNSSDAVRRRVRDRGDIVAFGSLS